MATRQNLIDKCGEDFVNMIDRLAAEELKKITPANCFDELHDQFDVNIDQKLPDVHELFNQLSNDVAQLEEESKILDDDIAKLKSARIPVTLLDSSSSMSENEMMPAFDRRTEEPQKSYQRSQFPDLHKSGWRHEDRSSNRLLRVAELKKHICNGKISHTAVYAGIIVFGLCKDEWKQGVVEDAQKHKDKFKYKVRFSQTKRKSFLQLNHLACVETHDLFPNGQMSPGSRVAACYNSEGVYSGVVAESADRKTNKGRYLIFFDDGYAMYCAPSAVYLVYSSTSNVWDDIPHKSTSDFIRDYLSTSERQLLSLKEGQTLKVEFEGVWHRARCCKVDCSLVEILYFSDNSTEWIYRGSTRLEPLLLQQQNKSRSEKPNKIARAHTGMRRAHIEYVDLTEDTGTTSSKSSDAAMEKKEDQWIAPWARSLSEQKANTRHPAATRIPHSFTELTGGDDVASRIQNKFEQKQAEHWRNDPALHSSSSKGSSRNSRGGNYIEADDGIDVDNVSLRANNRSSSYVPHTCSYECVAAFTKWSAKKLNGINPLSKPLLCGWTREISRVKPGSLRTSFHVYYRAPCGRACRNMEEVDRYFNESKLNNLDYDQFSFDHTVRTIIGSSSHITAVKHPRDANFCIPDYTEGKEDVPLSCVNEINSEKPPLMYYSKTRVPGRGVQINTSSDFMVCCDCPDNCRDRSKCPCQQLTVQATSCSRGRKIKKEAGYQFKRLFSFLPTGIYECNPRCKCNSQCLNRVVQKGLQCRLQMFKTHKKGWGIRCVDDIPRGSFVCIYTGRIQTEDNANVEGLMNGDEYLAELDHIEVAENQKEDYNSDDSSGFESHSDASDVESSAERQFRKRISSDSDDVTDVSNPSEKKFNPVTVIGGQKRKLGYAVDRMTSPLPGNAQPRRGKTLVMKKPLRTVSDKSETSSIASRFTTSSRDDDTTDTDSDTDVTVSSRVPTARKSTTSHSSGCNKVEFEAEDDENAIGTRRFFGTEGTYIIDAKQTGNLGRYLNHSCTPNLMVQNVFIDTHDLRFPWVAFFASSTIRSGTELTWDYNYEIGSVPDRIIHCYCGSTKCRKRLL